MVVEVAALLMFSALKNNDKVGLLTFCDGVVDYFPPRKGKANVLHLIRELVAIEPVARETDLSAALVFLNRVQKRRAVTFLISDFFAPPASQAMAAASRRHDLVAVTVTDPRERELPDVGFITLADAESGQIVELDTRHRRVRELFQSEMAWRSRQISEELRRAGVDELPLHTDEDYLTALRRFFRMRERRFR
jgi:uncharacterized protein (DUF58 family)